MLSGRHRALGLGFVLWTLAACVRTPPPLVPAGAPLLTIVTWNMHGGRGDLPRLIGDLEAGRLTGSPPRDYVLLLQEYVNRGDTIASPRSPGGHLSLFVSPVRERSGNAIISTMALADPRTIELPRERQPRVAAAAGIEVAGEELFVVSTHLENRLGLLQGLFGDRARGRQAEALLHALPPRGHGIVGGDMNTMLGPDEPAWRALRHRFPDTPEPYEPTFRDRLVLDHLFVDIPDGWHAERRVIADRYGSDHHPVVAQIRVR